MDKDLAQARVEGIILTVRGQRVILDADLATLYGVTTKALNQAVKRNAERFPEDFAFQLTEAERAEVVTNCDHLRRLRFSPVLPRAFTEHGAIMAANVLEPPRAIQMSVEVVRAFTRLRRAIIDYKELAARMDALEAKYDKEFATVFHAIRELMTPPEPKHRRIGFVKPERE